MAFFEFDATAIDTTKSFDPLPEGQYVAAIIESEFKTMKSGNGEYLELKWQVLDGPSKNRSLIQRLNLKHTSERTVAIAMRELANLCNAIGISRMRDSSEIHNIPVTILVKSVTGKDSKIYNEIKGFSRGSGNVQKPPF